MGALLLDGFGELSAKLFCGSSFADGIGEDMHFFKGDALDKIDCLREILVGFPCKADHDIGGYGAVLEGLAELGAKLGVLLAGVFAVHSFQRFVAAALQREVELRTQGFKACKALYILVKKHFGLHRAQAHTLYALHGAGVLDGIDKADILCEVLAVAAQIYACEDYLLITAAGKRCDLAANILKRL